MKPIKIDERNRKRIQACLDQAQKACTGHLVDADWVLRVAEGAHEALDAMRIHKYERQGIRISELHRMWVGDDIPGRGGTVYATHVQLQWSNGGWFLTHVVRKPTAPGGPGWRFHLPGPAREAIVRGTMRAFHAVAA